MNLKEVLPAKNIYIVSDGTGETASKIIKAAVLQFTHQYADQYKVNFLRYPNVRTKEQITALCEEASKEKDLMIYTLVSPQLRSHLLSESIQYQIPTIDLMGPLLAGLANFFGFEPSAIAGLLHDVNDQYFKRIEAMEFTVRHDDGKDLSRLHEADLVVLGISRTSKTPLSMYLSQQGWKVVNIPLIKGFELPSEIYQIDQRKIIGLTIDPSDLTQIRRNRLGRLGQNEGGSYADPGEVEEEINYADELFKKNRKWPVFNVTGKALEETASEILRLMSSRRLTPSDE
jgi:regulator of PEP synthase PpsR (kinase-PPPase family)